MRFKIQFLLAAFASALNAQAQAFINLDFESANVPAVTAGQSGGQVATTDGIPGWTAYHGATQSAQVLHNDISINSVNISILGPNWDNSFGIGMIDGSYSVVIQAGNMGFNNPVPASIAQTSLIPVGSQSIQLMASSVFADPTSQFGVTIGGQSISLLPLMTVANATLYGGDISGFAGETEELRIVALSTPAYKFSSFVIDSIVFSPQPIPEPATLGLLAFGSMLLGWQIRKRRT